VTRIRHLALVSEVKRPAVRGNHVVVRYSRSPIRSAAAQWPRRDLLIR
jgi:hypothetical protein